MGKIIEAIPTVYRGVQLRSRLESQACLLFDKLNWRWEYEGFSYLLREGGQYRPDFWIPDHAMFVETRGYETERSIAQLVSFAVAVIEGKIKAGNTPVERFLVLQTSHRPHLVTTADKQISAPPHLYTCSHCHQWIIKKSVGICYLCGMPQYASTEIQMSDDGRILVDGLEVYQWTSEGLF